MTFEIPLKYEYCHMDEKFIYIFANASIQNQLQFDVSENTHFEVCSPNGQTLSIPDSDNISPLSPNPKLQVSAYFIIQDI